MYNSCPSKATDLCAVKIHPSSKFIGMKNIILTAVALTFLAYHSDAQEQGNKMLFGVKVGTNYSNVYDENGEDFKADAKFGLAAGAYLTIPLMKFIAIQPEILFSQKGFKATGRILGSTYNLTRTTDYIDVPLFLVVRPIKALSLMAGPQYAYLLKQKDKFDSGTIDILQENEFKNDNIRKNTLCLVGGVDLIFTRLVLSARAGWDVKNNNGDGTSTTPRYKNVWLQGTVGIRL